MKIVIFNNLYFPYNKGGAEQYVLKQVNKLKSQNHQIIIISTKPFFSKQGNSDEIYYLNSLYYHLNKVPKFIRFCWHIKQLLFSSHTNKIKAILKKESPDMAISHNLLGLSWQIPKVLKNLNIKHQHTLHDIQLLHPSGLIYYGQEQIINQVSSRIYQRCLQLLFKHTTELISPSQWLLKLHQEQGFFLKTKNTIESINQHEFPKIIWPKKISKLIFVGQLEKHKGFLFLLNFIEKHPNLSLTIIGDGSLKEKIKTNRNLNYLGKLNKNSIITEMKKHDCLIVPSICYENIPMVILEASSVSLPTIASNIGGLVELKNTLNLRLFTPNSELSLANVIENDAISCPPVEQK